MLIDLSTIKERSCAYNQPHPRRGYLLWKQDSTDGRWREWECLGVG